MEHGNFSTKDGDMRRVWKGNTTEGNKQLFRLLRLQSSPTLKRILKRLGSNKRKTVKCTKCGVVGHKRSSRNCPMYEEERLESSEDEDDEDVLETITEQNDDEDDESLEESDDYYDQELSSSDESVEITTVIVDENNELEGVFKD